MSNTQPKPPQLYTEFVGRYPDLARAWEAIADAGRKGPLDDKTTRLVKPGGGHGRRT